jgi:GTP-binding protein HflX
MPEKVPDIGQLRIDFMAMIQALEDELVREQRGHALDQREKALLVGVTTGPSWKAESHLDELEELARSDGLDVVAKVVQRLREADPRFLIARGSWGNWCSSVCRPEPD